MGRAELPLELQTEPVTEDDLQSLGLTRPTSVVPLIQKIRETHHNLARCIAAGIKYSEVAARTGFSQGRISTLMADPSFQNLVAEYRERFAQAAETEMVDFITLSKQNAAVAARQVQEMLEEVDDGTRPRPKVSEYMEIIAESADRAGYAKQSRIKHEHDFSDLAARLEDARRRAFGEGSLPQRQVEAPHPTIELEVVDEPERTDSNRPDET